MCFMFQLWSHSALGVGLFMHTDALLSSFKFCISVASSLGVPATGIQCVWQMEHWCMCFLASASLEMVFGSFGGALKNSDRPGRIKS